MCSGTGVQMVNAQREECIPTVSRDYCAFRLHNKRPHSGGKPIYNNISRTRAPAGLGTSHNSTIFCPRLHHVTSHNTYVTLADKLWLVLSHGTHHCHFHTTPEIPRTSVLCSSSDVIKS